MARHEFLAFGFILVYGVSSLPWPRDVGNSSTSRTNEEAKAPAGGWTMRRHTLNNSSRTSSASPESIVFVDEEKTFLPAVNKIPIACRKGSTFCESVNDYPSNHVDSVVQNGISTFRSMFGNDYITSDGDIAHRIDNQDENPLCASSEQVVFPKTAKNKNDKWMFIVNQGEHKQGVRIETCLDNGGNDGTHECFFSNVFPLGYRTSCKQKYIYRKLLALDENGDAVSDTFQLPSCCSCVLLKSDNLMSKVASPTLSKEEVHSLKSKIPPQAISAKP